MATLTDHYPALLPLTAEELAALTPEKSAALLSDIQKAGQQINNTIVQLETQKDSLTQQIRDLTEQAKREFGVETLEELETLQAEAMDRVQSAFQKLSELDLEAA